jgi:hypothetical protein
VVVVVVVAAGVAGLVYGGGEGRRNKTIREEYLQLQCQWPEEIRCADLV